MSVYAIARERACANGRLFHVAAILWRHRTPVRISVNSWKTHPKAARVYPSGDYAATLHAEMDALRFARPGDVLEVLRFTATGLSMAKPCKYCMSQIEGVAIRVRYTDWKGNWQWL